MKFEEQIKQRMNQGKEYTGVENWDNWTDEDFINNAQEELLDCYNYMDELITRKIQLLGLNDTKKIRLYFVRRKCKDLWDKLEEVKKIK